MKIGRYTEISPLDECDGGKSALASECLGPPTRPQNVSDISPSAVAYWIATKGGLLEFNIADVGAWKLAFDALLEMIVSGDVEIWGRRFGNGLHEKIDGRMFVGILVDYPCQDCSNIIFGDDPYLECHGVLDDQYWHNGLDDKLFSRRQLEWSHLRIKACDVARFWPFQDGPIGSDEENNWRLPDESPHQKQPAAAYKALLDAFPTKIIPKHISAERLAEIASKHSKKINGPPIISRDTVLRALGRKK
jgi:hypothetical protein